MVLQQSDLELFIADFTEIHEKTPPWCANEYYVPQEVGLRVHRGHRSQHNKQINPPNRMVPYKREVAGGGYKHRH